MKNNLKGKIVLITGASSGIGLSLAKLLASEGCNLVLPGRNKPALDTLASELMQTCGVSVITLKSDLSEAGSADRVYSFTKEKNVVIDILINNAGFGYYGSFLSMDKVELCKMLQLNMGSLSELCHLYSQDMKSKKGGAILNIASTAAYQSLAYFAVYAATKAYVLSFSEALASELQPFGISVACLSPGPTHSNFFSKTQTQSLSPTFNERQRMPAIAVARAAIKMLHKGSVLGIPGTRNAMLALGGRFLPRALLRKMTTKLMKPVNL